MSCATPKQETERPTNPRVQEQVNTVDLEALDREYRKKIAARVPGASPFTIKDSGERQQFDSGMVRDVTEGKVDYSLVLDGPMFKRWAIHLTNGALKYAKRNWMKASGDAEFTRFKESALRHFIQWYQDERDEDHASAVFFNISGAEYVKSRNDSPSIP